jgi:hypothetical protein
LRKMPVAQVQNRTHPVRFNSMLARSFTQAALPLLPLLPLVPALGAAAAQTDDGVLSFEGKAVPSEIESSKNSTLALSDTRFIDGKQSLRWSWHGGPAWLLIHHAIAYQPGPKELFGEPSGSTFAPRVYLHQPMQGTLHFTFGRHGQAKPDCGFDFGMDFIGWRTAWLMFDRDMHGKPVAGATRLLCMFVASRLSPCTSP